MSTEFNELPVRYSPGVEQGEVCRLWINLRCCCSTSCSDHCGCQKGFSFDGSLDPGTDNNKGGGPSFQVGRQLGHRGGEHDGKDPIEAQRDWPTASDSNSTVLTEIHSIQDIPRIPGHNLQVNLNVHQTAQESGENAHVIQEPFYEHPKLKGRPSSSDYYEDEDFRLDNLPVVHQILKSCDLVAVRVKHMQANPGDCRLMARYLEKLALSFREVDRQGKENVIEKELRSSKSSSAADSTSTETEHIFDSISDHGLLPPKLAALGSIADACESAQNTIEKCTQMGKLRSFLWCEQISTDFSKAARELMTAVESLLRVSIPVAHDVTEDLQMLANQLSRTEFRPSEQYRSCSAAIRATISVMQRQNAETQSIHSAIKRFIVCLDEADVSGESNTNICAEILQEKDAVKKDIENLKGVGDERNLFLLRQILAVLDAEQHVSIQMVQNPKETEVFHNNEREVLDVREWRWHVPTITAVSLVMVLIVCGLWAKEAVMACMEDGKWIRAVHIGFLPVIMLFMLFACYTLANSIVSGMGPIAHLEGNSKYYSNIPPPKLAVPLPRVTIQMPVFKESLAFVIKPSLESLLRAAEAYRILGGSYNIYINDDGLMMVPEEERAARIAFYESNGIAYCARPPHGENGYVRHGRFKKASNMNFCLQVSQRVEQLHEEGQNLSDALKKIIRSSQHDFIAAGDVRIGDFILLVDSDTRVPEDCIAPTVTELLGSKSVAFTQHSTTPMQVVRDYWENAISHFTVAVYNVAIRAACSGGDVAPLVGHNAFLRWEAMKECAFTDPRDGCLKFWSEEHVSEDFDLALRFQVRGYYGRYVTYTGKGFQEGVSLTVHDEIIRFKKYSFGAAEMLFNPVHKWYKGPISSLYWSFLVSGAPWWSKITVTSYMGSYFAISSAWWLAILHYFLFAWSEYWRDEVVTAVDVMGTVLIVFSFVAPLGSALLRYRLGMNSLLKGIFTEFMHVPVFMVFFNGLSFHLFGAVLSHFFQFKMQFGITSKEVKNRNFFQEVAYTIAAYRWCYAVMAGLSLMVVALFFAPPPWSITSGFSIIPLVMIIVGHFFTPILLNPVLMRIKF